MQKNLMNTLKLTSSKPNTPWQNLKLWKKRINMHKTIYTEVEVDVDLSEFEIDDLIEELESRGAGIGESGDGNDILRSIYEKRRLGNNDYQTELD